MRTRSSLASLASLLGALLLVATGCKKKPPTVAPEPAGLQPLAAEPTQPLPLGGHGPAVVDVPAGVTRAVPVLVAVLGIGDTPEEQCAMWRELVGVRAFVVCTRGAPHYILDDPDAGESAAAEDDAREQAVGPTKAHAVGFYPVDLASLEREVTTALAALKAQFGAYVDDREPVYAGFSRGAFLGASLVAKHPERFRRVILIEGGQSAWSAAAATSFAKGGGQRVLFACGQQSCVGESEAAASLLKARNIGTRVVMGPEGHGYKKAVKEEVRRSLDWVTEGDARWAAVN